MNPLRIFSRLRRLEASTQIHNEAISAVAVVVEGHAEALRPIHRAIRRRLEAIEQGAAVCAKCRALIRPDRINEEDGPRLMERVVKMRNGSFQPKPERAIVCHWCELGAKRLGWTLVKLPRPPAPTEPPKETEVPA